MNRRLILRSVTFGAALTGVLAFLVVVVVVLPPRFAPRDAFATASEAVRAQNEVRTTLMQGLGGAVLLLGAYVTWRQFRHTVQANREQHELDRHGQMTERFTRAIDQLGNEKLEVILGGIYALERIARDSPSDRATIAEVLTAYVRGHAPWPPSRPGQYVAGAPLDALPPLHVRAPDLQATMTVLSRGGFTSADHKLNLSAVDLRKADLGGAKLEGAHLASAHLEGVFLGGANLSEANLAGAHLEGAVIQGANLSKATLIGVHLEGRSCLARNWRKLPSSTRIWRGQGSPPRS